MGSLASMAAPHFDVPLYGPKVVSFLFWSAHIHGVAAVAVIDTLNVVAKPELLPLIITFGK